MRIIESIEEFQKLSDSFDTHGSVLVPVFSDHLEHPAANTLCVLGIRYACCPDEGVIVLPFNHTEANNLPISCLKQLVQFAAETPDANILRYIISTDQMHIKDVQALEFTETGKFTEKETFYPTVIRQMHERHYILHNNRNVNQSVPLYKWVEFLDEYTEHLLKLVKYENNVSNHYRFLQTVAIPALHFVEKSGLHVDIDQFKRHFYKKFGSHGERYIKDGLIYSQYNLFTATGRPSCRFGGINFAALNKEDGTRKVFTSRFDDGSLILIDFESYHLRLIANMVDYQLPKTPAHEYFGRQYFGTDKLTQEQYNESKVKSFQLLYGDIDSDIPFFRKVKQYKDHLWKKIQEERVIESPLHGVEIRLDRIWEPNPAKVFNYLIQLVETERNLTWLDELSRRWGAHQSKIILYNYDAILIDYHPEDGMDFIKFVVDLLSEFGKYPVRVKQGKNYDEMEYISPESMRSVNS